MMEFSAKDILLKSNLLSLFRLLSAIPAYFMLSYIPESNYTYRVICVVVLVAIAFTDFLDGRLARKYNEITELGKILDPLADKVAVIVVCLQLFQLNIIPAYFFMMIFLRDIFIFLGGLYVTKKIGRVLPSNKLGKITVFVISIYIMTALLQLDVYLPAIYSFAFYSSLILVILSFLAYLIRSIETIKWYKNETV